jgi:diadenosine tetraphosphate (Ap4A) HIT family hydrolase
VSGTKRGNKRAVYEDKYYIVVAPERPLNCRDDGGHLILLKKSPVTDRSDLTMEEAIDFMRISMAVGRAMYDVLKIERMNYEDLGNWGLDDPGGPKMHLHFMGRAAADAPDPRPAHRAVPEGSPALSGPSQAADRSRYPRAQARIAAILRLPKYQNMAELAAV